jgi:hypothetical protein
VVSGGAFDALSALAQVAAFGTGIEKVKEELEAHFDPKLIFEINREATPTARKAQEVAEQFYATKGSILVGTEMALSFLHKKVDTSAIAAFDSLFSVPDFRIREKIFRLVIEVRSVAKEHFFLQSRNIEDEALNMARSGNLIEFYKMESDDRRALQYPPFSIFIKVTVRGGKPQVSKSAQELKNIFALWSPAIFPSLHEKRGEAAALNAVIKIPRENWPDPRLLESLRNLSPQYEITLPFGFSSSASGRDSTAPSADPTDGDIITVSGRAGLRSTPVLCGIFNPIFESRVSPRPEPLPTGVSIGGLVTDGTFEVDASVNAPFLASSTNVVISSAEISFPISSLAPVWMECTEYFPSALATKPAARASSGLASSFACSLSSTSLAKCSEWRPSIPGIPLTVCSASFQILSPRFTS